MGLRVGADIARVADVAASVARFGDRYLERLFTPHEIASCSGTPSVMAASLAARFAAKEAAIKVLRPTDQTPAWRTIEVRRNPSGWCELRLSGDAAKLAAEAGITELAVSLSHDRDIAAAVVLAQCGD
ncbi:MAG: holo-ACP synthase [Acidimicrobiales bacterium]|jgi:holo-[acyl-carrier protein] synthase